MKDRLKDEIKKLDAMERAQGAAGESSSHPRPFPNVKVMKTELETIFLDEVDTVHEDLRTASKIEDPNVQTISAKQMQAFNNKIAEDESSTMKTSTRPTSCPSESREISTNSKLY